MAEQLPGLHDAGLVGVSGLRAEGRLTSRFRRPDGAIRSLHFTRCHGWRIAEFVPQNVVSHASVSGGAGDEVPVRTLIDWLAASPAGVALPGSDPEALADAILHGNLRIASFEASTGAEAVVVFETLECDPPAD